MALSDFTQLNTPEWQQFLNASPHVAPNPQGMQTSAPMAPSQPMAASPNYAAQLQQIMAPYQGMAQQVSQPYSAFAPNSILGRILPQGLQSPISNALLGASMAREGGNIGQDIIGGLQGVVGAQNYNRDRMLQGAMLPYQMAGEQLKNEDVLAQMNERAEEIPYRHAMEQRAEAQSDWYMHRIGQNPPQNSEDLKMHLAAAAAGVPNFNGDFSNITADQANKMQSYLNTKAPHEQLGGSSYAMAWSAAHPPKNGATYSPAEASDYMGDMQKYNAQLAGQKAGSEQTTTQPLKDSESFINDQLKDADMQMKPSPVMSEQAFNAEKGKDFADIGWLRMSDADRHKAYQTYNQQATNERNNYLGNYSSLKAGYQTLARTMARQGQSPISWTQYQSVKQQLASGGPTSGGNQPGPSAPKGNRPNGWPAS